MCSKIGQSIGLLPLENIIKTESVWLLEYVDLKSQYLHQVYTLLVIERCSVFFNAPYLIQIWFGSLLRQTMVFSHALFKIHFNIM